MTANDRVRSSRRNVTEDRDSRAPVGRRPLFAVLTANAVSQVGDMMVAVAMPWFVLQTTGSVIQMGLAGAVIGIGALLSSVTGGPLVDRFGLRRASILSDLAAGCAVAAIPLLFWADLLPFWLFLVLALLVSVLNAPGDLARRAMVPTLAGWAAMPLERANSADTAIPRFAQLLGPILGGVLVAFLGAAHVLLLDAATFLLSAVVVAVGVPSRTDQQADRPAARTVDARAEQVFADCRLLRSPVRQYLVDLRDGFHFVRTSGLLISLIVITAVANLLEKPLMSVVAPVHAQETYGSATSFGAMLSAFGAGALAGTVAFSLVGHRLPRRATFLACMAVAPALMFGALAATPPLAVLLAALGVSGVLFGPMNSLVATVVQTATPPALLGRVFGTVTAMSMVGIPIGATVAGLVVAEAGLVGTLLAMGGAYLLLAAVMTLNPALRAMDVQEART